MAYQCRDCSFKRKGAFLNGKCPACGSFNIAGGQVAKNDADSNGNKKWRLVVLALLWVTLFVLLFQKIQP